MGTTTAARLLAMAALVWAAAPSSAAVEVVGEQVYGGGRYVPAAGDNADPLRFSHGNAAFRFDVANPGAATVLRVATELPRRYYGNVSGQCSARLSAEFGIAAGAVTNVELHVPFVSDIYLCGDWKVSVPGEGEVAIGRDRTCSRLYVHPSQGGRLSDDEAVAFRRWTMRIAASPSVDTDGAAKAYDEAMRRRGGDLPESPGERRQRQLHDLRIFKTDFSTVRDWRELSVFDAVVIDARDHAALPKGFMNGRDSPLLDWVASGGRLVLLRGQEPPGLEPLPRGLGEFVYQSLTPDWRAMADALVKGAEAQAVAGLPALLPCDVAARRAVGAIKAETPFGSIVLVLLAFTLVSGPLLVLVLARMGRRIHLLWVFPLVAVAFSVAVMAMLVSMNGVNPVLRQFAYTVVDEKAGKAVTVQNDVIVAPLPMAGDIRYPDGCVIAYDGGDGSGAGEEIALSGGEWRFRRGWTPTLWPVVFRTVTVRPLSAIPDGLRAQLASAPGGTLETDGTFGLVTLPLDGALGAREVRHTLSWRGHR